MASEGERCGGLGSFLAMSCRGRAEAFARRLHTKLRSLGSHDENGSADESSWLAAHENSIAISQPAHSSHTEKLLDLALLDSPESPEAELEELDFNKLMNKDTLQLAHGEPHINATKTLFASNSIDSDSDLLFYDTEDHRIGNHTNTNGIGHFEDDFEAHLDSLDCSTASECASLPVLSLSEDTSMLSMKDEDLSSLEVNGSLSSDLSKCNGDVSLNSDNNFGVKLGDSVDNTDSVNSYESKEPLSLIEEEDDEDLEPTPRVRRSTSLKTGKTPPGTPGQKKIVRFADALGLDLADVRTFLDDIPKIPNSAFQDLLQADLSDSVDSNVTSRPQLKATKYLMPLFQQPGGLPNFLDIVRENNLCLENVYVDDPILLSLKGTVRVRNLDFHKSVHIRYTLDSWKTFADVQGTYVDNSCDGFSDKFTFLLYAHTVCIGQRLELACRFQCKGCQYWDNNNGLNYCFQCLPPAQSIPHSTPIPHDDWGASFY